MHRLATLESLCIRRGERLPRASRFPVALPEGPHPFPSRTRKLSPPGPMVLRWQRRGRVGRCRGKFEGGRRGPLRAFQLRPTALPREHGTSPPARAQRANAVKSAMAKPTPVRAVAAPARSQSNAVSARRSARDRTRPAAKPPAKPPAWARLFTPARKNPEMKRIRAHCPYCCNTSRPKAPPRLRAYAMIAPRRPKMEPEAPTVNNTLNVFDSTKPTAPETVDRKSTRLNSSHLVISYAV